MPKKQILIVLPFALLAIFLFVMAISTDTMGGFLFYQSYLFLVVGIANFIYFIFAIREKRKIAITFFLIAVSFLILSATFFMQV